MLQRTAPLPTRQERLLSATKLHEILRIALDDLKVVEKDPRYHVDMSFWHYPSMTGDTEYKGKCVVCLAGATIAVSLQHDVVTDLEPDCFTLDEQRRLCALDALRRGAVEAAQKMLVADSYETIGDLVWDMDRSGEFEYGRPGWWPWMERMWLDLVAKDI